MRKFPGFYFQNISFTLLLFDDFKVLLRDFHISRTAIGFVHYVITRQILLKTKN